MKFEIIRSIFLIVLFTCTLFMIPEMIRYYFGIKKYKAPKHSDDKANFAIIIPARNESRVIEANLKSIRNSSYPKDKYQIYVIVETEDDPTVDICKKYDNVNVFYRKNLNNIGKGYALDECMEYILQSNDIFDSFMILDADNIVSKGFLGRMNDAYQAGYDVACGNRNNKDWDVSVISSSSALTFLILNSVQNKAKTSCGMNITVAGTGFFVSTRIIKELGGWKFYSLTEDYEFSNYALCNKLKTCYIDDAIYYDEQPITMKQSIVQRTRWIKGYFFNFKKFRKKKKQAIKENRKNKAEVRNIIGAFPAIVAVIDIICYFVFLLIAILRYGFVDRELSKFFLSKMLILCFLIYVLFLIFTALIFHINKDIIKISRKNKIKAIFFHPIFLASYVIAAIRAVFVKSSWEVIEHSINKEMSDFE